MLSVTINVQKRDNRLGTADGIVTIKNKGEKPLITHFNATPHQIYIKGAGGDRIHPRNSCGVGRLYPQVAAAALELYCCARMVELNETYEEINLAAGKVKAKLDDKMVEFE